MIPFHLVPKNLSELELLFLSYYGKDAPPPDRPALSREQEKAAFLRYFKRRNPKDREVLLRQYLCWAFKMAAKFKGPRLEFDDAISAANEGLVESLNDFDPTRGFRFTTYAAWAIRRKLISAIVNTYPVHITDSVRKEWRALHEDPKAQAEKMIGDEPATVEEFFARIAEGGATDVSALHEQPTDAPFAPGEGQDPRAVCESRDRTVELKVAIRRLPRTMQRVLRARMQEPAESYISIGRRLRISKSRARDLHELSLVKLRRHFGKDT